MHCKDGVTGLDCVRILKKRLSFTGGSCGSGSENGSRWGGGRIVW